MSDVKILWADDEIDLLIEELKTNNKNVKVLYADNLLTLEI